MSVRRTGTPGRPVVLRMLLQAAKGVIPAQAPIFQIPLGAAHAEIDYSNGCGGMHTGVTCCATYVICRMNFQKGLWARRRQDRKLLILKLVPLPITQTAGQPPSSISTPAASNRRASSPGKFRREYSTRYLSGSDDAGSSSRAESAARTASVGAATAAAMVGDSVAVSIASHCLTIIAKTVV